MRTGPGASAAGSPKDGPADTGGGQVFRSPLAVVVWWLWVLFAAANLIDLAIQGRDHLSLLAALTLILISGLVYVTALRPKMVADPDGLTIVNPVRVHRVGWAAVVGADSTDLLRVRCEWPAEAGTGQRAIYSWAVHSSHRGKITAEAREKRQARRVSGSGRMGFGAFGPPPPDDAPPPAPLGLDAAKVIADLTERAEKARAAAPDARAVPPVSRWHWPAVAAIGVPAIALLIAVLA